MSEDHDGSRLIGNTYDQIIVDELQDIHNQVEASRENAMLTGFSIMYAQQKGKTSANETARDAFNRALAEGKPVSMGCSVKAASCSICGKDGDCKHTHQSARVGELANWKPDPNKEYAELAELNVPGGTQMVVEDRNGMHAASEKELFELKTRPNANKDAFHIDWGTGPDRSVPMRYTHQSKGKSTGDESIEIKPITKEDVQRSTKYFRGTSRMLATTSPLRLNQEFRDNMVNDYIRFPKPSSGPLMDNMEEILSRHTHRQPWVSKDDMVKFLGKGPLGIPFGEDEKDECPQKLGRDVPQRTNKFVVRVRGHLFPAVIEVKEHKLAGPETARLVTVVGAAKETPNGYEIVPCMDDRGPYNVTEYFTGVEQSLGYLADLNNTTEGIKQEPSKVTKEAMTPCGHSLRVTINNMSVLGKYVSLAMLCDVVAPHHKDLRSVTLNAFGNSTTAMDVLCTVGTGMQYNAGIQLTDGVWHHHVANKGRVFSAVSFSADAPVLAVIAGNKMRQDLINILNSVRS